MQPLFSHNDSTKQAPDKAPTSYKFFQKATAAKTKASYPVEVIFKPGTIVSWGFVAKDVRFNIYERDSRYNELEGALKDVIANKQELFIKYSPNDRGLATLVIGKADKVVWEARHFGFLATR